MAMDDKSASEKTERDNSGAAPAAVRSFVLWWRGMPWATTHAFNRMRAGLNRVLTIRPSRSSLAFVHDVGMAVLAFVLALYLRLDAGFLLENPAIVGQSIASIAVGAAMIVGVLRLYRSLWCFASLQDMITIVKAATLIVLLFLPVWAVHPELNRLPAATLVIDWLLLIAFLAAPRMLSRLASARKPSPGKDRRRYGRIPLLLVGTGNNTELFLRALERDPAALYRVVGIVDEMGAYLRGSIHGIEILGRIDEIRSVVQKLDARGERPQKLVVTEDRLAPAAIRALLEEAAALGLTLNRTPRVTELRAALGEQVVVKPIAIEDLLGRPQTLLDRGSMAQMIHGARVLVTGAGGTIGSELVRQISDFGPAHIALVDNAELHLYEIDLELRERHRNLSRVTAMADVRDRIRIREVFDTYRPELVFHAAAMKHVPMVEMNPCEGVLTNVLGTRNVADACVEFGVKGMVLISTDKAVNPTSVMGVTKRVAESYCQSLDMRAVQAGSSTRFLTVRFGNVLGSTGSVVPLFQRQLAAGGPMTVTDPDVTRYFMTVTEAVGLVLQASALGTRSSDGKGTIFVLEMGDPVRIRDLASQMIRLAGLIPGKDIDIVYTGLRPGEKLYEEPLHASEEMQPTEASGILLAAPRVPDHAMLIRLMDELLAAATERRADRVRGLLDRLVPEYQPTDGTASTGAAFPGETGESDNVAPLAPRDHRQRSVAT
jgi:O-antigen biosynthesis protein WbqV